MLHKITPEYLCKYINFFLEKEDWQYNPADKPTMQKLQAEGSAKAWNLLCEYGLALISDEVGMGKTLQALAVMVTLWKQKPNAKIILYAPNTNVALKWQKEYDNFIRYHFREPDDIVCSSINHLPLRSAIFCENHAKLLSTVNERWPSFLINKISSLSHLGSPKFDQATLDNLGIDISRSNPKNESEDQQEAFMVKLALKSNQRIKKMLGDEEEADIDLLIIDEAHYLRKADGESNRSNVAYALFAGQRIGDAYVHGCQLASKVLLLTATPNHSTSSDISNIISYFKPEWRKRKEEDILRDICIRRFRRLNGKTKHEYRNEIPERVEMKTLTEKLFFAAYQKSLVVQQSSKKADDKRTNPYRIMTGYLEGFEFLPRSEDKIPDKRMQEDFHHADDTEAIIELSKKYARSYGRNKSPKHPKYDELQSQLSPIGKEIREQMCKRLVFVRRIPSVKEIAERVKDDYDAWLLQILKPPKYKNQNFDFRTLRRTYWKYIDTNKETEEGETEEVTIGKSKEVEIDGLPYSKILDLFVVKRDAGRKYKSTDCSNFRLRFSREVQIFSIFFEPAADYNHGVYLIKKINKSEDGKKVFYLKAIREDRLNKLEESAVKTELRGHFKLVDTENYGEVDLELQTLIGIFLKKKGDIVRDKRFIQAIDEYSKWSVYEKESFSNYLSKGILLASPFIVYMYTWYREGQKQNLRGEDLYKDFSKRVEKEMQSSGLEYLITEAIISFRLFYKKELAKTDKELLNFAFTFLQNVPPVYPYFGGSKRPSILTAFNSPFFPNALISTSVLQEGVDLHYQCAEVIHYGIAWTQGDNEQRVGRVDRMNGKLEIALTESADATLPIRYPYLANTLDESQLIRFANKKFIAEKLIDELKVPNESKEVNFLQSFEGDSWSQFFKKPTLNEILLEPFEVKASDFAGIETPKYAANNGHYVTMKKAILKTLSIHFKGELVIYDNHPDWIGAIQHKRTDERDQPVIIELDYYEPGMFLLGKPVFVLKLKSPLTKRGQHFDDMRTFGKLKQEYEHLPILKICLDEQYTNRNFKYYVRADLPVICDLDGCMSLSEDELIYVTKALIHFTDDLEKQLLNTDIKNNEVITMSDDTVPNSINLTQNRIPYEIFKGWETNLTNHFLIRKKNLDSTLHTDNYIFNHQQIFLKQISLGTVIERQICVYHSDALKIEMDLLDKILKFN